MSSGAAVVAAAVPTRMAGGADADRWWDASQGVGGKRDESVGETDGNEQPEVRRKMACGADARDEEMRSSQRGVGASKACGSARRRPAAWSEGRARGARRMDGGVEAAQHGGADAEESRGSGSRRRRRRQRDRSRSEPHYLQRVPVPGVFPFVMGKQAGREPRRRSSGFSSRVRLGRDKRENPSRGRFARLSLPLDERVEELARAGAEEGTERRGTGAYNQFATARAGGRRSRQRQWLLKREELGVFTGVHGGHRRVHARDVMDPFLESMLNEGGDNINCHDPGGQPSVPLLVSAFTSGWSDSHGADSSSAKGKKKKCAPKTSRKTWKAAEEELLMSAWLNVSEDSIVGTDQSSETYWGNIVKYCEENANANWTPATGPFSPVPDDAEFGGSRQQPRPIGRDAARKARARGASGSTSSVGTVTGVYRDELAQLIQHKAQLVDLWHREVSVMERAEEDKIMAMDLSSMDEASRQYFTRRKAEIIASRYGS